MKAFIICALIITQSSLYVLTASTANEDGDGRAFSLFSVVTFQNLQCTAKSSTSSATLYGTCLSSTECSNKSGAKDGNCASGFGVCCLFTISTCTASISQNCTYVQNPSYSSAYTTASTTCTGTISLLNRDICQIRYDFETFVLASSTTGQCTAAASDYFLAVSPTGATMPTICGTNTGQHMYVEVGTSTTSPTYSIVTGTGTSSRTWRIKISQIECTNPSRAPVDCVKYFTGISGSTASYNHGGGQMLYLQNYQTCIRKAEGYCSVSYSANAATSPSSFLIGSITTAAETTNCPVAFVQFGSIQTGASTIICEGRFSPVDADTVSGTVIQTSPPFMFLTKSDSGSQPTASVGYLLDYSQVPC